VAIDAEEAESISHRIKSRAEENIVLFPDLFQPLLALLHSTVLCSPLLHRINKVHQLAFIGDFMVSEWPLRSTNSDLDVLLESELLPVGIVVQGVIMSSLVQAKDELDRLPSDVNALHMENIHLACLPQSTLCDPMAHF
jgi:hypothetical protein